MSNAIDRIVASFFTSPEHESYLEACERVHVEILAEWPWAPAPETLYRLWRKHPDDGVQALRAVLRDIAETEPTTEPAIIGYDTSEDAYDLSVLCAECSDQHGDEHGTPLYAGDEWGGEMPRCKHCGAELEGLTTV